MSITSRSSSTTCPTPALRRDLRAAVAGGPPLDLARVTWRDVAYFNVFAGRRPRAAFEIHFGGIPKMVLARLVPELPHRPAPVTMCDVALDGRPLVLAGAARAKRGAARKSVVILGRWMARARTCRLGDLSLDVRNRVGAVCHSRQC